MARFSPIKGDITWKLDLFQETILVGFASWSGGIHETRDPNERSWKDESLWTSSEGQRRHSRWFFFESFPKGNVLWHLVKVMLGPVEPRARYLSTKVHLVQEIKGSGFAYEVCALSASSGYWGILPNSMICNESKQIRWQGLTTVLRWRRLFEVQPLW